MLSISLSGIVLFTQSFQDQDYIGKYFHHAFYIATASSEKRESYKRPLLLEDAYLQLTARENFIRAMIGFGDAEQKEQEDHDAVRLLSRCFATQPRYEELNLLMLLYQKRGEFEEGRRYFKYYPPEEREKFLKGRFDGKYMM